MMFGCPLEIVGCKEGEGGGMNGRAMLFDNVLLLTR